MVVPKGRGYVRCGAFASHFGSIVATSHMDLVRASPALGNASDPTNGVPLSAGTGATRF